MGSKKGLLLRDESGAVVILFALLINVILGMVALAIDGGRGMMTDTAIASAADPGALAGAITDGDLKEVEKYFRANLESGMYGIGYNYAQNVDVTIAPASVTVTPTGFTIPTFFTSTLNTQGQAGGGGGNSLSVSGGAAVSRPGVVVVTADVAFALDFSSSMNYYGRIEALRNAMHNAFDIIETANEQAQEPAKIAVGAYGSFVTHPSDPMSTDIAAIEAAFDQWIPEGSTCGSCIMEHMKWRVSEMTQEVKAIIFMTDGAQNTIIGGEPSAGGGGFLPQSLLKNAMSEKHRPKGL